MRAWRIGVLLLVTGEAAAGTLPADPPLPPARPPAVGPAAPAPPLPPVRPPEAAATPSRPFPVPVREVFGPPMPPEPLIPPPAPPAQPRPAVPPEDELACVRLLTGRTVEARAVDPPAPTAAGCSMPAPVEIAAVLMADGRRIPLVPPVTIGCPFGAAFADWVREDLAPAFDAAGTPLVSLVSTSGYACRGRNNVAGAKLSEHARGDAIDVGGFRTRGGQVIGVKQTVPLLQSVKASACARFSTVLGPGSDGFHEEHLHVDAEPRRHGGKLCQWTLP